MLVNYNRHGATCCHRSASKKLGHFPKDDYDQSSQSLFDWLNLQPIPQRFLSFYPRASEAVNIKSIGKLFVKMTFLFPN